jgi:two-component system sensor histidine kinase KdpD
VAIAATAGITFPCFRLTPVNATTAGFCYLVEVLIIATVWGLREAVVTSVVAVLCFNFFFFEPVGTFTVSDPHNWVALFSFLAAIGLDRAGAQQVAAQWEAARQSQELKSTLLEAVAHEFKTPLTSIKGARWRCRFRKICRWRLWTPGWSNWRCAR